MPPTIPEHGSGTHSSINVNQHANSTNQPLDPSNPLYLSSSDHPGAVLVSKKFDGTGFLSWRRAMIIAIFAKKKQGFISGKIPEPAEEDPSYEDWHQCNYMLISWILNSLTKEILDSVIYTETASQIWSDLNARFGQSNGASRLQLKKEIANTIQGTDNITNYFTRLMKLWDELQVIHSSWVCGCKDMEQFLQEEKLLQFLMGLNESYSTIRGSITVTKPLPSLGEAYSMLLHEEKQREIGSHSTLYQDKISLSAQAQRGSKFDSKKSNLTCSYCKKTGHIKEKCYRLIGFPSDFKFTKNKKFSAAVQGDDQDKTQVEIQSENSIQLNNDQCMKLLSLLNQQSQAFPSKPAVGPFNDEASASW